MFPNNTIQAATINSTLFSEDIQGRVDLTSNFDGRELNTEVSPSHSYRLIQVPLWIIFDHRGEQVSYFI
jgi:hypothetical protein